jgi:chromosome segregation ATPase
MADQSYRDTYEEVATLRQEMADAEADVRRLVDDLAEANRRLEKTREQRDTWRTMHHEVEAQRDKLRQELADAAWRAEAIAELRRVLDGGGE